MTLVFIHSIAGSPAQWTPQLDAFEQAGIEVLAVALPGHAGTERIEAYTVEALAAAVLDQLGDRRDLVLVGHSGGALVATHLAASHPDRVRGLLLVDPGTDGREFPAQRAEPMLAALRSEAYPHVAGEHWGSMLTGGTEATRGLVMADLHAASPQALPDFLAALGTYDAVTPLRQVAASIPVVAVTTPLSDGPHALAEASDDIEVVRVDDTSHWVQLDRPEAVNDALDRLLARIAE